MIRLEDADHAADSAADREPTRRQIRIPNRSGEMLSCQLNALQISWKGTPATLLFVRDITKELELERRLRQAQKMEAIGALAGGIAHDFNNILSGMVGYAELAMHEVDANSDAKNMLRMVLEAGERAADLVSQILTFSRQTEQDLRPTRIHSIVKEALRLLRATVPANVQILHDVDDNCEPVVADITEIHQVVMNLCTNAYQAISPGHGVITVRLEQTELPPGQSSGLPGGRYARLTVSDTGSGMDAAVLARVFEPYFTTKEKGRGTGLGLATVHGIVTSIGGGISVTSTPGEGSTFEVLLPTSQLSVGDEDDEFVPPLSPARGGRILLAEDEPGVAEALKMSLTKLGYETIVCPDGYSAMREFALRRDDFVAIITDNAMPKMTGLEFAAELHAQGVTIPVIMCTGFADGSSEEAARASGIAHVLHKPIRLKELADALRTVLDTI